jgi:hypothetical protein
VEYIQPMTPEELLTKVKQAKVGMKVHATWRANGDEEWTAWHGEVVVVKKKVFVMWESGDGVEDDSDVVEFPAAGCEVGEVVFDDVTPPPSQMSQVRASQPLSTMEDRLSKTRQTYGMHTAMRATANAELQEDARQTRLAITHLLQLTTTILSKQEKLVGRVEQLERTPSKRTRAALTEPLTEPKVYEAGPADDAEATEEEQEETACAGIGLKCAGCQSFICIAVERKKERLDFAAALQSQTSEDRKELAEWMAAHGLLRGPPPSCECGSTGFTLTPSKGKKTVGWRCRKASCRRSHDATFEKNDSPFMYVRFLYEYVCAEPAVRLLNAANDMSVCRKTVATWTRELTEAAMLFNAEITFVTGAQTWKNVQWDETFWAQRKFHRGRRVRQGGILTFVGGVEVEAQEDGRLRVIDAVIAGVPSKAREQQTPLILEMTRPGATVTTDGAAMYSGFGATGRTHKWVNHSKCFVTKQGVHTNAVEGMWNVLKRIVRGMFTHQGPDSAAVAERFQLALFMENSRLSRLDMRSAVFVLARYGRTLRANGELYDALVVSAKAVFGMPSGQDLEDLKAEIERKAAEEQEKDEAAAREAAFMTNYGADSENDEPLNQLGSKSHLSTPSAASRTPIARRVHFAEPEASATLDCNGSFDELELELVRSP